MTKANDRKKVILVADAHERLRAELVQGLKESMEGWDVLSVGDGVALLDLDQAHHADAVVMDIVLPGMGGLDVIERLKRRRPGVKIVVFSLHEGRHFQERALEIGASAFIGKGRPFSDILDALKSSLSIG